jgi:hypothetical protein
VDGDSLGDPRDADNVIQPDGTELTGAIAPGGDELAALRRKPTPTPQIDVSITSPDLQHLVDELDKILGPE